MKQIIFQLKKYGKKMISPLYYFPQRIEIEKRKRKKTLFLPDKESVEVFLKTVSSDYIGVVSSKKKIESIKKKKEIDWIKHYIKKWISIDEVYEISKEGNEYYIFFEIYEFSQMAKQMHRLGYKDGINFILLLNGKTYREHYSNKTMQRKWFEVEKFRKVNKDKWIERILIMKEMISKENNSVLDIGCWECELKKILPSNIKYYGCDYVKRNENTLVCDLNQNEFPLLDFDVAYISGSLEYMEHLNWYFDHICLARNEVILSYSLLEYFPLIDKRKKKSWVNHLTAVEIITSMMERKFSLTQSEFWGKWTVIFKFEREKTNV